MVTALKISRAQLAKFLGNDHDAIRQFENLFKAVEPLTPAPETDVVITSGSADAKAQLALEEVEDLKALVDLLVVQSQVVDTAEGGAAPAPGPGVTSGSAVLDFGAFPGSNEASIAVTGQASILASSEVAAWLVSVATADHTADDHAYAGALMEVTAGAVVAGDGFTIYGRSMEKLQGTFNVQWAWI